jgi:hypothetical protein
MAEGVIELWRLREIWLHNFIRTIPADPERNIATRTIALGRRHEEKEKSRLACALLNPGILGHC